MLFNGEMDVRVHTGTVGVTLALFVEVNFATHVPYRYPTGSSEEVKAAKKKEADETKEKYRVVRRLVYIMGVGWQEPDEEDGTLLQDMERADGDELALNSMMAAVESLAWQMTH